MVSFNLILIAAYFIVVLAIGYWSSRRQSEEDYLLAGRSLPWWKIGLSNASGLLGAGMMVMLASMAFLFGLSVAWALIGALVSFALFGILSKRVKKLGDTKRFYTFPDYFYNNWGKSVGLLVTILIFVTFFILIVAQFIGGGIILASISGWSYTLAVLISGAIISIYLLAGGFRAIIKTDIFQYLAMIVLLLALFISTKTNIGAIASLDVNSGLVTSVAFAVIGFFAIFSSADIWQRIYAAKTERDNKIGLISSGILLFVLSFAFIMIGIIARANFPTINANDALVAGLFQVFPGLFGVGAVVVFAALMSSIDTALFVAAMNISKDMASRYKQLTHTQIVLITKLAIISLSVCAVITALFFKEVLLSIFVMTMSVSLILSPIVLGSFFFKLKNKAVLSALIAGIVYTVAIAISGIISPELTALSLPISTATLAITQKLFK